jgi:hypothetical protein
MPRTYVKTQSPADPFSQDKCFDKEEGVREIKTMGKRGESRVYTSTPNACTMSD